MTLSFVDLAEQACDVARLRKRQVCEENRGVADLNSFLFFRVGDRGLGVQSGRDGHPIENLPSLLREAWSGGLRRFDCVSFAIDAYFRTVPLSEVKEYSRDYVRGDLAKEFSSDPLTDIVEAVVVMSFSWTGDSRVDVLQYRYDDDGVPQFVDPDVNAVASGEQIGGVVKKVLSEFVDYCRLSPVDTNPE